MQHVVALPDLIGSYVPIIAAEIRHHGLVVRLFPIAGETLDRGGQFLGLEKVVHRRIMREQLHVASKTLPPSGERVISLLRRHAWIQVFGGDDVLCLWMGLE